MSDRPLWLESFAMAAEATDGLSTRSDHLELLSAGLLGEVGSVLTEMKKREREREAYPAYRERLLEEMGDLLWYFVRLVASCDRTLLAELELGPREKPSGTAPRAYLGLGASAGAALNAVTSGAAPELRIALLDVWTSIRAVARETGIDLAQAAGVNTRKIRSRWPRERVFHPLFDEAAPDHEQLPRRLELDFTQATLGPNAVVTVSCDGAGVGDQLSDNIQTPDGYRYHDVFHFAHAVYLGWSPVVRAVLKRKRKSTPQIDEAEDGARAAIIEEAVSAIVFSRAKQLAFFDGLDSVDYGLLKTIQEFVEGYEVADVPLWQWEQAILEGYSVFRELHRNRGGRVTVDLIERRLAYAEPPAG